MKKGQRHKLFCLGLAPLLKESIISQLLVLEKKKKKKDILYNKGDEGRGGVHVQTKLSSAREKSERNLREIYCLSL